MISAPSCDPWAQQAAEQLSRAGYRRGGARGNLLALLGEQRCALSAVEIHDALRQRQRRVSRASIYRILEELEQIGVVQRLEVGGGMVRYEPVRSGTGHHHHLVCDHCGILTPFSDAGLERAIKRLSERLPQRVAEHEVILRGACQSCDPA